MQKFGGTNKSIMVNMQMAYRLAKLITRIARLKPRSHHQRSPDSHVCDQQLERTDRAGRPYSEEKN